MIIYYIYENIRRIVLKRNVLISIKPKYVEEILSGKKKYEYRKRIFKEDIEKVYIYSSSPQKRIVGYFKFSGFLVSSPKDIWNKTSNFSGINKADFDNYFYGKKVAYAIKINNVHIFKNEINPKEYFSKFYPPQSYMYLEGDIL